MASGGEPRVDESGGGKRPYDFDRDESDQVNLVAEAILDYTL